MKRIAVVLLNLLALVVGVMLGCVLLGKAYPTLDGFTVRQKVSFFEKHRDNYDILFLGSSRVHHQISPSLFDQLTKEAGMPTRSFNLGVDGMFPPEDSYLAEYVLATRPKKLRWVFVEVSMFLPPLAEESPEAPRSIYWHDLDRTRMAVQHILGETKSFEWRKRKKRQRAWKEAWARCDLHLAMFVRNSTNFGRGAPALANLLTGKSREAKEALGAQRDGYSPILRPKGMLPGDLKKYDEMLAKRAGKPVSYDSLSPAGQENLDRILTAVYSAGATPILVVTPAIHSIVFVPAKPAKELYLDFSDIDAWPELYRKEHRADYGHLTQSGAEIYTRYIAEAWLAAYGPKLEGESQAILQTTSTLDSRAPTP